MFNTIRNIISKEFSIRPEKILEENDLKNDLHIDREDMISLVTEIEDEYDIIIDYNKLDSIKTVNDLESYVTARVGS